MTNLDVHIEDPDDDDLTSAPPVFDGGGGPTWKPVVAAFGGLLLIVAAFAAITRSSSPSDQLAAPTTIPTTTMPATTVPPTTEPTATTAPSMPRPEPEITAAMAAVAAWEEFTATGDLASVETAFDAAGPQFQLFSEHAAVATEAPPRASFSLESPTVTRHDTYTTVSATMVATSGGAGVQRYPFDFVFMNGTELVWTVIDRRAPGEVALPAPPAVIEESTASWQRFTEALVRGDHDAAMAELAGDAAQTINEAGSSPAGADAVIAGLFSQEQIHAMGRGQLGAWLQLDDTHLIATLVVDGDDLAPVPFTLDGDRWVFDIRAAVTRSGGPFVSEPSPTVTPMDSKRSEAGCPDAGAADE